MDSREEHPTISEFVLGQLSPEEALRLLDRVEVDPQLSAEVEDCTILMQVAEQCGDVVFSDKRTGPWLLREPPAAVTGRGHGRRLA